jgi:hypothetical protein
MMSKIKKEYTKKNGGGYFTDKSNVKYMFSHAI